MGFSRIDTFNNAGKIGPCGDLQLLSLPDEQVGQVELAKGLTPDQLVAALLEKELLVADSEEAFRRRVKNACGGTVLTDLEAKRMVALSTALACDLGLEVSSPVTEVVDFTQLLLNRSLGLPGYFSDKVKVHPKTLKLEAGSRSIFWEDFPVSPDNLPHFIGALERYQSGLDQYKNVVLAPKKIIQTMLKKGILLPGIPPCIAGERELCLPKKNASKLFIVDLKGESATALTIKPSKTPKKYSKSPQSSGPEAPLNLKTPLETCDCPAQIHPALKDLVPDRTLDLPQKPQSLAWSHLKGLPAPAADLGGRNQVIEKYKASFYWTKVGDRWLASDDLAALDEALINSDKAKRETTTAFSTNYSTNFLLDLPPALCASGGTVTFVNAPCLDLPAGFDTERLLDEPWPTETFTVEFKAA